MMTNSDRPFLLQFGEQIASSNIPEMRYDLVRQVIQVMINGRWIDAVDACSVTLAPSTRRTDVRHETTDED